MILDLTIKEDINKFSDYAHDLLNKGKKVELKEIKNKRTLSQNAYLHVCITLYAINYGLTLEEAKTDLKRACHFMIYEKNGNKYLKRTRDFDTKELTDFIDWIRSYAGKEGLYIPTSEEYLINKFQIDKEIDANKEFL